MIIPFDHPNYIFPYNLEDRILYIINSINKILGYKIKYSVYKKKNTYTITIDNDSNLKLVKQILDKYDFKLKNDGKFINYCY